MTLYTHKRAEVRGVYCLLFPYDHNSNYGNDRDPWLSLFEVRMQELLIIDMMACIGVSCQNEKMYKN